MRFFWLRKQIKSERERVFSKLVDEAKNHQKSLKNNKIMIFEIFFQKLKKYVM